ncbi:serine/threonine-protein phosphatase 6 regulatory ankyrin repeat subunit B-like isoform X3 [Mercenaria mercenaria]|uniref:serine/threonine-protein phosphatase 6 regulatory ankyrin repeat subunit B-like isoform X3 n=1 Tax=Mercenaria mercenaria TaxID=6596 RepID=UPI00234FA2D5|nr:serine/threonine-protein phosphatase 6 regulatory ankyrin repeat subunit B-like isoform X3 [Mercenaria mercenaria]
MMLSYFDTEEQTADQARLYETCLKGSREEIRNYCRNGDIASLYIKDGMNPMHVVAIAGRKDAEVILDMMLQNGFHVNDQTMSGDDTVLHLIVEHIDVKAAFPLVLKILEYNPDLQIRNRKLRTPYDLALARGEFELAEVLDGHMTASEAREYYKNKIAAIYGPKKRVLSPRTKRYFQAKLIDAVLRSNENDIQDFLKLGADPNYVNEHKNGAIHYAITHCTLPPQRTLQLLIDGKADVNLQDDEGDTALNLVIKMTKLKDTGEMYKCAELLVQNGALSTLKDLDGNDALSLAKKRQYDDIVKLLTDRRPQHIQLPPVDDSEADHPPPLPRGQEILPPLPESPNEEPEPATDSAEDTLVRAIREGTLEEVNEALFGLRADPNIPGDDGLYPIHHVLIRGEMENEDERIDMLKSLIEAGADINQKTVNSESTALHVAATKNQYEEAQVLLDTHKCDYNLKNKHEKTAYDIAEEEECQEVMDVIENHRRRVRQRMQRAAKASTCIIL